MGINQPVKILDLSISVMICGLMLLRSSAFADGTEDIRILKISPQDERAVIKMPDGKVKIIKAGDVISSNQRSAVSGQEKTTSSQRSANSSQQKQQKDNATVTIMEIADGRIVLEEKKGDETETIIIRMEDGKQHIERIRKMGEKRPELMAPLPAQDVQKKSGKGSRFN